MTWALSADVFAASAGASASALESMADHPAGHAIDQAVGTWWKSARSVTRTGRINFNAISDATSKMLTYLDLSGTEIYKICPDQEEYGDHYVVGAVGGGVVYDFGVDQRGDPLPRVRAHIDSVYLAVGANVKKIIIDAADEADGPWTQMAAIERPSGASGRQNITITCGHTGYSRYVRIRVVSTWDGAAFYFYKFWLIGSRYQALAVTTPRQHKISQYTVTLKGRAIYKAFIEARTNTDAWVTVAEIVTDDVDDKSYTIVANNVVSANEWRLVAAQNRIATDGTSYAEVTAFEGREMLYDGPLTPTVAAGIDPDHVGIATYMGRPMQDLYSVATSSEDSCYPARRLTDRIPSLLWRPTSGATSSTITMTASGTVPCVQGIALIRHGMDPATTAAYAKLNNGAERAFAFGANVAWVLFPPTFASRIDIRLAGATSGIGEVYVWSVGVFPAQNYVYGSSIGSNLVLRTYAADVVQYERCLATRRRWIRQYSSMPLSTVNELVDLQHGRYVVFSPAGYAGEAVYGAIAISDAIEVAPDKYDLTVTVDELPLGGAGE